jgi:hypothetical protein
VDMNIHANAGLAVADRHDQVGGFPADS